MVRQPKAFVHELMPTDITVGAMRFPKKLWHLIQGDPIFMRRLNGWLTVFWIFMIPVSIATGWISSVAYVSALSLWALVASHWSSWQASRIEVKQYHEAKEREENPPEKKVVKELVKHTTLEEISSSGTETTTSEEEEIISSSEEEITYEDNDEDDEQKYGGSP